MALEPEDQLVLEQIKQAQELYEEYSKVADITRVPVRLTISERPLVDTTARPIGLVVHTAH